MCSILWIAAGVVSCHKTPTPPAAHASTYSPADVIRRMHAFRRAGSLEEIAPLLVAERRDRTLEMLAAVDGVLAAEDGLNRTARRAYGTFRGTGWDLSAIRNNLGPFSRDVRIISQRFRGNRAEVTLQAGNGVPLVRAEMQRTPEGWQFRPEPVPQAMIAELYGLIEVLQAVQRQVEGGMDYAVYVNDCLFRVTEQMSRVALARDPAHMAEGGGHEAAD